MRHLGAGSKGARDDDAFQQPDRLRKYQADHDDGGGARDGPGGGTGRGFHGMDYSKRIGGIVTRGLLLN